MPVSPDTLRWHFAGIMLTVFLAALHARVGRVAPWWQVVSALPGTIAHELSHLLVAFVTGGRPQGFSVIPRARECRRSDGAVVRLWTLGSVTIGNAGVLSAFPTGFAPLCLNVVAWYLYRHWFSWFPQDLLHTLGLYLAVSVLCSSSLPSSQDVRVAFSSLFGVALYGGIIVICCLWHDGLAAFLHSAARLVMRGSLPGGDIPV
jgi:hypothetical protein